MNSTRYIPSNCSMGCAVHLPCVFASNIKYFAVQRILEVMCENTGKCSDLRNVLYSFASSILGVIAPMHLLICGWIIPGYCRNSFGILRRLFCLTLMISSWCELLFSGRDWLTGCGVGGCCCIDTILLVVMISPIISQETS